MDVKAWFHKARTGTGRQEGPPAEKRAPIQVGDGTSDPQSDVATLAVAAEPQVVGESHYGESFAHLCGPPTPDGYLVECLAQLIPEPHNAYDSNAVAVWIDGFQVGYLGRDAAREMGPQVRDAIAAHGAATCHAVIRGGWDRGHGDVGGFGVRLLTQDDRARARWSNRMRTDPSYRRHKLAHWQWQVEDASRRGWPPPRHALGGIEFYGRIHQEWHEARLLDDPEGHTAEYAELEASAASKILEYARQQAEIESEQRAVIAEQLERIAKAPSPHSNEFGKVDGRHFTEFVEEVKSLMREGRGDEAEALLLRLVAATEEESRATGIGVAPWYYERLAVLYAKRKARSQELAVLERFAQQPHAPGVMPRKLLQRLDKVRTRGA